MKEFCLSAFVALILTFNSAAASALELSGGEPGRADASADDAAPRSHIDAFYVDSNLGTGSGSDSRYGRGGGGRVHLDLVRNLYLSGEYTAANYRARPSSYDFTDWRAGLGYNHRLDDGPVSLYGEAEYVRRILKFGTHMVDDTGYAMHLGANIQVAGPADVYLRAGYLGLDSGGGLEVIGGAGLRFDLVGLFAEYHHVSEHRNVEPEFENKDVRVGLRYCF